MAVTIQYVVMQKGGDQMTFASRKEADAYDKMLETGEHISDWLVHAGIALDENARDALGFYLAENKDTLLQLLRGIPASVAVDSAEPKRKSLKAVEHEETTPVETAA